MFSSEIRPGTLTVPCNCVHIFLLGGFWDTTEPDTVEEVLLKAEGNTSLRGRVEEVEGLRRLPLPSFLGDGLGRIAWSFLDARELFTSGLAAFLAFKVVEVLEGALLFLFCALSSTVACANGWFKALSGES
ncbi:unnamed protein product [Microthlaspi erraticum]|uniref:Uncharacterized protein n=1 Tax=Microthlaspi erraticum TaxID=1685480 RepID=A0A6D2IVM4_9BRAS|nr:unnamed protein product [Microthlaspi erraticum]